MERVKLGHDEYLAEVLALVTPLTDTDLLALADAAGRTLAAPVVSRGPVPAFANSAMDGFACRHADLAPGAVLRVVADLPAGSGLDPGIAPGECARIMTGAPVPTDADTIVPVELASAAGGHEPEGRTHIRIDEVPPPGAHVRHPGEDLPAGAEVLPAGSVLDAAALGLAAAAGAPTVAAVRRPRVAVAATGDELRAPGADLDRGQIYESNGTFLAAAAARDGAEVVASVVLSDDEDAFAAGLDGIAADADLVVVSGGVSVGEHDVVRLVLGRGDAAFRHVRMQPGKPQGWARRRVGDRVVPVVCLPGNPLSTLVSYELFVRPALLRLLGAPAPTWGFAVAEAAWSSPSGRAQFVPVTARLDEHGVLRVRPAHARGSASHVVSSAALADGLAAVPEDVALVAPGDVLGYRRFA